MAKTFSVTIPTKPYIKEFISREFGNPVCITNYSLLGIVVVSILQKPEFSVRFDPNKKSFRFSGFTEKITCLLPLSLMYHYGYEITGDQAIQINRFFEEYFDRNILQKNGLSGWLDHRLFHTHSGT